MSGTWNPADWDEEDEDDEEDEEDEEDEDDDYDPSNLDETAYEANQRQLNKQLRQQEKMEAAAEAEGNADVQVDKKNNKNSRFRFRHATPKVSAAFMAKLATENGISPIAVAMCPYCGKKTRVMSIHKSKRLGDVMLSGAWKVVGRVMTNFYCMNPYCAKSYFKGYRFACAGENFAGTYILKKRVVGLPPVGGRNPNRK